jgi:hypothetical protein
MLLQTYTVVEKIPGVPTHVGRTVYEWPYENWGLADDPENVVIFTKPSDVVTVYSVPARHLQFGAVVEVSVKVGVRTCIHTDDETTRFQATERPRQHPLDETVRSVALMLAAAYWRGTFKGRGGNNPEVEELIRINARRTLNDWLPSARLAMSF